MDTNRHLLRTLLDQLGVPAEGPNAEAFLASHHLEAGQPLADAPFWTAAQSEFLREAIEEDADWCGPADELAARLTKH